MLVTQVHCQSRLVPHCVLSGAQTERAVDDARVRGVHHARVLVLLLPVGGWIRILRAGERMLQSYRMRHVLVRILRAGEYVLFL